MYCIYQVSKLMHGAKKTHIPTHKVGMEGSISLKFAFLLSDLAEFEDGSSQVSTLISEAASVRNISRMDPAWNPWL